MQTDSGAVIHQSGYGRLLGLGQSPERSLSLTMCWGGTRSACRWSQAMEPCAPLHPLSLDLQVYNVVMPGWLSGGPNSLRIRSGRSSPRLINAGTPAAKCWFDTVLPLPPSEALRPDRPVFPAAGNRNGHAAPSMRKGAAAVNSTFLSAAAHARRHSEQGWQKGGASLKFLPLLFHRCPRVLLKYRQIDGLPTFLCCKLVAQGAQKAFHGFKCQIRFALRPDVLDD